MDTIIKIGGSLAEDPERLRALCRKMSALAKKYAVIVVPGGGMFADVVRGFDQQFELPSAVSHRMAILAMDQFGLLLSQIIPGSRTTYSLDEAKQLAEAGVAPVFLASHLMFTEDPLDNSWDVTSDSIAAYVAGRVSARKLVLATDVDGIFTSDPKKHKDAKLIERLSAEELHQLSHRTSVDLFLPKLLLEIGIDCYVVNGKHPERAESIMSDRFARCTFVSART